MNTTGNLDAPNQRPVALVTGASRGLGFLIARALADRGYDLAVCARSRDGLDAAAADLGGDHTRVLAVAADVGDRAQADQLVATTVEEFGRLDLLVANAGIIQVGPVSTLDVTDFEDGMHTLYWGTVYPTLAALPVMREAGGGRILAVTSLGGKLPAPHLLPYTAAKHAAVGFAEGLRVEAGRYGVSVTTAVPGLMRTGSTENAWFAGEATAEHTWFALGAGLPLLSIDGATAAERIVAAALAGKPEVVITLAAKVAVRAHGFAPATIARLLALTERLLPGEASTPGRLVPGWLAAPRARWFRALTTLNRQAAERAHQRDDRAGTGGQGAVDTSRPR